ncbi:hypothetical protein [Bradyrhizobium sp. AZCC 1610]|uniref:hypothetical protein n=1 Tax=Bradyrhizobium sp. AZCC 1610 TaxID=3117020 RepID=UPI003FA57E47
MLPSFRFLFTAIVLSMSILVFGLGAAALLRAAHEEFANLPSRRATPEPMFARQNDGPPPTLALLRIDPPVAEKPAENVPAAAVPEATPDIPAPTGQGPDAPPAEPEKLAAVRPAEPVQVEAAKPEAPAEEAGPETPAAPAPAAETVAPVATAEVKLAAIPETPEPAAATPPPPAPDIYSFEGNVAATQIATLGGPAVIVDEKTAAMATEAKATGAKATEAKPDNSAVKKRAAERVRERRRIAVRRAHLAREAALAAQQQLANPFAQLTVTRTTR